MKFLIWSFLLLLNYTASAQTLTKLWETEALMDKPESAVFDRLRQVIYVSNINGKYCTKDGNGFIAKVALDGTIQNLNWITGLDSPQGLAIYKNRLYVADVDQVVVIDIKKGRVEQRFKAEGAIFLNDIAADTNGDVCVSDCKANRIYRLKNNRLEIWSADQKLNGPNGLFCLRNEIMLLNMGGNTIYRVDKRTQLMTEFCSGIKNLDGITPDGGDGYFVSGAWQGELSHLDSKGEKRLLLDLEPEKIITADITYIPEKHLLIVPTLKKTVIGYLWQ